MSLRDKEEIVWCSEIRPWHIKAFRWLSGVGCPNAHVDPSVYIYIYTENLLGEAEGGEESSEEKAKWRSYSYLQWPNGRGWRRNAPILELGGNHPVVGWWKEMGPLGYWRPATRGLAERRLLLCLPFSGSSSLQMQEKYSLIFLHLISIFLENFRSTSGAFWPVHFPLQAIFSIPFYLWDLMRSNYLQRLLYTTLSWTDSAFQASQLLAHKLAQEPRP